MSAWLPYTSLILLSSLGLCGLAVLVGLMVAGKSLGARASRAMLGSVSASGLVLLLGVAAVYRGLEGLSPGFRLSVTALYGLVAVASLVGVAFLSAVAFNR